MFLIDISTNDFPADYFDRRALYYKNHDKFNHPIRKLIKNIYIILI